MRRHQFGAEEEALGVNSQRDLAVIERLYQRARADALLDAGVSLADPARIDVRGTLSCGRDVRADVSRAVVKAGWDLIKLDYSRSELENTFIRLVGGAGGPDASN